VNLKNSAASAAASLKPFEFKNGHKFLSQNSAASAAASLKRGIIDARIKELIEKFRGICRGLIEAYYWG